MFTHNWYEFTPHFYADPHTSWLVGNMGYAHPQLALLQIAKMYTCEHDI